MNFFASTATAGPAVVYCSGQRRASA